MILKTLARLLGRVESEGVKMSEKIPAFNKLFMTQRERDIEKTKGRDIEIGDIFKICISWILRKRKKRYWGFQRKS